MASQIVWLCAWAGLAFEISAAFQTGIVTIDCEVFLTKFIGFPDALLLRMLQNIQGVSQVDLSNNNK